MASCSTPRAPKVGNRPAAPTSARTHALRVSSGANLMADEVAGASRGLTNVGYYQPVGRRSSRNGLRLVLCPPQLPPSPSHVGRAQARSRRVLLAVAAHPHLRCPGIPEGWSTRPKVTVDVCPRECGGVGHAAVSSRRKKNAMHVFNRAGCAGGGGSWPRSDLSSRRRLPTRAITPTRRTPAKSRPFTFGFSRRASSRSLSHEHQTPCAQGCRCGRALRASHQGGVRSTRAAQAARSSTRWAISRARRSQQ